MNAYEPREPVTRLRATLYAGVLGRAAIDRVAHAVSQEIGPQALECRTVRHGTTFVAGSVSELRQQVRRSVQPGDPDRWTNLSLVAADSRRTVAIRFRPRCVTVSVESVDAVWARGKLTQLGALLTSLGARTGPSRWTRRSSTVTAAIVGTAMLLVGGVALDGFERPADATLLVAATGLVVLTGYLTGRRNDRRHITCLHTGEDAQPPPGRAVTRTAEILTLALSWLASTATIASALVAVWP
jgi:hypothetical protein